MNRERPSENRISWTTVALNHSMGIQQSIKNLRISRKEVHDTMVAGTVHDSNILHKFIQSRVGISVPLLKKKKHWAKDFWYDSPQEETHSRASDKLEEAFNNVVDLYLKHQNMLDDAEKVEIVETSESDTDEEPEDVDNIEW